MTALYPALCGINALYKPLRLDNAGNILTSRRVHTLDSCARKLAEGWAIVAPAAPDLVCLDLDGCADERTLPALDRVAASHGAALAYRAASGSPKSEHRAYALPASSRAGFRAAVAALYIRPGSSLEDRTADHPTANQRAGRGLRLPGSPSLKDPASRVVVWPMDAHGMPLDLWGASRMIAAARRAVGLPDTPPPLTDASQRALQTARKTPGAVEVRPHRAIPSLIASWSAEDNRLLLSRPARGSRSDAALSALRVIVRNLHTDEWEAVRSIVMGCPVFDKFTIRGEEAARRWWEAASARYARYLANSPRGERLATPEQRALVDEWLHTARRVLFDAHGMETAAIAYRAACVIAENIWLDGGGVTSRPIAVRSLEHMGACRSTGSAWHTLHTLEAAGLLSRASEYSLAAPLDALQWSMKTPSEQPGERDRTHLHTPLGNSPLSLLHAATSDECLAWRPTLWCAYWSLDSSAPTPAVELSRGLGVTVRAVRRWFGELLLCGAAIPDRGGWRAVPGRGANRACVAALWEVRARVAVERRVWCEAVLDVSTEIGRMVARVVRSVERRRELEEAARARRAVALDAGSRAGWPVGGELEMYGLAASGGAGAAAGEAVWAV
uniref:Uncharacterized protein n=1 Tax=uncultured prokaryote TaxID=198431 RepID=A0A0H5PYJ3_9ZZZZ|nr:hypothetical protein [uncultured prokaryote]